MKTRHAALLAATAVLVAVAAPVRASAAEIFGSAAIGTVRSCTEPTGEICVIRPASTVLNTGGLYQNVNSGFDLGTGSSSQLRIDYSAALLPELRGYASGGADTRVGSNLAGFRSYTYAGSESIDLALNLAIHFVSSGDFIAGDGAGEGELNALLYIARMDFITELGASPGADNIFNCGVSGGCGTVLALGAGTSFGHAGDTTLNVMLDPVLIHPGDQFIIGATMQMRGNRGGSIDALNTVTASFDLDRTVFAGNGLAVGAESLARDLTSMVPEAQTWALMVLGFAGLGGAVRRRRAAERPACTDAASSA